MVKLAGLVLMKRKNDGAGKEKLKLKGGGVRPLRLIFRAERCGRGAKTST